MSIAIKLIFFNSNSSFIYLKKYLEEIGFNNKKENINRIKKINFSQFEIEELIIKDFKEKRVFNINGWILSESEIKLALSYKKNI